MADQGDEEVDLPDCLQDFGNQCSRALISGEGEDLQNIMKWWDDEWEHEVEAEDPEEWRVTRFVRHVRSREMADSLRMLARLLYE